MASGTLLLHEEPLLILPQLACRIGLNEAVVLQQLHYWLQKKTAHELDGRRWVYNSYAAWQEQFPFWSLHTIQRTFLSLQRLGLVHTQMVRAHVGDRRKWYSINYAALEALQQEQPTAPPQAPHTAPTQAPTTTPPWPDRSGQSGTTIAPDWHDDGRSMASSSKESERSTERSAETPPPSPPVDLVDGRTQPGDEHQAMHICERVRNIDTCDAAPLDATLAGYGFANPRVRAELIAGDRALLATWLAVLDHPGLRHKLRDPVGFAVTQLRQGLPPPGVDQLDQWRPQPHHTGSGIDVATYLRTRPAPHPAVPFTPDEIVAACAQVGYYPRALQHWHQPDQQPSEQTRRNQ